MTAAVARPFRRAAATGGAGAIERAVAVERPVAIEVNGLGYAVLMATPDDLEDLAYGFMSGERLIEVPQDVWGVEAFSAEAGVVLRVTLDKAGAEAVRGRVRHRTTESACGLCGIENLEQALRPLPAVTATTGADDAAVFAALASLASHQPLNRATGAVHAAAACAADGTVRLVREDVGRHNALDKLNGAMMRRGLAWDGGFALVTSRCSYELVEKAVLAGCPMLATLSAPTSLAVERAAAAGLALRVLVRPDALLAT